MCKPSKVLSAIGDPLGTVIANNAGSNTLLKAAAPLSLAIKNAANGQAVTPSNVTDPGYFFHQSQAQKDAAAYAAAAPQRAADDALNQSNNALASLRQRRRAGSALATGGTSGGGSLSSVLAYGKSTLG